MNLPYSDNLNIGYLSRLFDRNRVFITVKYSVTVKQPAQIANI